MGYITTAAISGSDGSTWTLELKQRYDADKGVSTATTKLKKANRTFLTLVTSVAKDHSVALSAKGSGYSLEWTIDFSRGRLHKNAPVTGKANGNVLSGVFNGDTGHSTANIALGAWLPRGVIADLAPFEKVLKDGNRVYKKRSDEITAQADGGQAKPIPWGKVACWGFGGMGAAAACIVTAGIGCVLAGFGFGAGAAICDSQN